MASCTSRECGTKAAPALSFFGVLAGLPTGLEIQVGGLTDALAQADLAITKSGTVTMECALHGVPAVVLMPSDAAPVKIGNTKDYGAEVVLYDRYSEDREALCRRLADERSAPRGDRPASGRRPGCHWHR